MNDFENSPLYRIMHPAGVAFWGASNNPTGMGSVLMSSLRAMGFEGDVYPIHPREKEVAGLRAYSRISEVPGPVDLAVIVIPTRIVPEVMEDCGKAGVKGAIVVSGGFGEAGDEGKRLQEQIGEIARRYNISFLGPNCLGVVNPYAKLNTTFMTYDASPGFVGMASQSGSFITQMSMYLDQFGMGFSEAFSVGNEAQTDITDCLEYLGQSPETKVIALYIETIRRGRKFFEVAKEVSRTKPIVACYVGGSEAGRKAALSHTGALAGPDALYDGIFKQCGIIRASSMEEMFDICYVLGTQPLPKGDRFVVLTHSGGPGASAADAADRSGLRLANLSPETLESLQPLVPHTASVANPVDLTFNRNPSDYTDTIPRIILQDPHVDSLFIYLLFPTERVVRAFEAMTSDPERAEALADQFIQTQCDSVAKLAPTSGKPVVGGSFCPRSERFIRGFQDGGVPVLSSPERAVRALGALSRYAGVRRALVEESGESDS